MCPTQKITLYLVKIIKGLTLFEIWKGWVLERYENTQQRHYEKLNNKVTFSKNYFRPQYITELIAIWNIKNRFIYRRDYQ